MARFWGRQTTRMSAVSLEQTVRDWIASSSIDEMTSVTVTETTNVMNLVSAYFGSTTTARTDTLLVAPACTLRAGEIDDISLLLSQSCSSFGKVYGTDQAPYLSILHKSPARGIDGAVAAQVSDREVMDAVFLYIQQALLGYSDDNEEDFVKLGRQLLTVERHTVTPAASEAAFFEAFWSTAADVAQFTTESSVMLVAPGFAERPDDFSRLLETGGGSPLGRLLASAGAASVSATAFAGGGLRYPFVIVSPPIEEIVAPEDGYKVITSAGEVDVEEYIRRKEEEEKEAAEKKDDQEGKWV
ncbi:unnamed protein product [Phaeothamnion confervicola]